ncbi:MAG TPA: alpha/beta fold hydrolase [Methylibium sp.]|uniref:alpha/beta fold hydrolase n=1 Tax=Methylibium sp. TaxID=2067992 RepID=UPI002DBA15EE|nr:alpha/beta fold hydrolase [Methylibium sp.]HEU4458808.1 alpha/beta fold hydrolase [Methylibium sp.]
MAASGAPIGRRAARSKFFELRGLRLHVHEWGDARHATPARPTLVMAHGWMDVGASFQFVVDALAADRHVIAPDWRGFGGSIAPAGTDAYWFPDYLGDLDALLDAVSPDAPVDLLGHSMGGNVAMGYAGVRPRRVRRLVNLEGFGLPASTPQAAPKRIAQWLDELKTPQRLRDYASLDEVAERLRKNNPRLSPERAAWLAPHWSRLDEASGRWVIQGDPAHKRTNPVLYRVEEALACWQRIEAPVLWAEGAQTDVAKFWGSRYPREEFEARIAVVPRLARVVLDDCAHMLHHDQPERLAAHLEAFLDRD